MTEPHPVTGAWCVGDDPGSRRFLTFATDHPFAVESGDVLRDVTVAYETWGQLDADGSNAVLVLHAWTGDSHAAGRAGRGHEAPGWWDDVVGPGKHIDTNRWFVRVPERPGRLPGFHRAGFATPRRRSPLRIAVSGRDDPATWSARSSR